uniref:MD-2-related lipid-recognition domain-containing protein n=1 Tax=Onchocerca volvulus TaxID=6282 RepID=A0A8R1U2T9_ONCVO
MLVSLITIISMLQYAVIAQFPNGTDTKIHFFTCNPDAINVSSIVLLDRNDLPMYPIKLSELATIKLKSYNNGDMIKKNKVNVEIFEYKEENGIWKWKNIIPEPFRFLLHNIDGCKMANNCPLTRGDLDLILPLDLYKYAILFSFIDKTSAHQFIIKMFNAENHQEVACETIQFKLI